MVYSARAPCLLNAVTFSCSVKVTVVNTLWNEESRSVEAKAFFLHSHQVAESSEGNLCFSYQTLLKHYNLGRITFWWNKINCVAAAARWARAGLCWGKTERWADLEWLWVIRIIWNNQNVFEIGALSLFPVISQNAFYLFRRGSDFPSSQRGEGWQCLPNAIIIVSEVVLCKRCFLLLKRRFITQNIQVLACPGDMV